MSDKFMYRISPSIPICVWCVVWCVRVCVCVCVCVKQNNG